MAALAEAGALENHLSDRDIADLKRRLKNAADLMANMLEGSADARIEWPFAMLLEDKGTRLIVDGTMDLVFKSADGALHVIDYKFSDEPDSALRKKYNLQLNLYRLALRRLEAETAIRSTLIVIGRSGVKKLDIPEDSASLAAAVAAAKALDAFFTTATL